MRTVGVEEELLLVDSMSGRPRSVAELILGRTTAREESALQGGSLEHELQKEQLETYTAPHSEMSELGADIRSWRETAIGAARRAGARAVATATSPIAFEPHLFHDPRFEQMAARFGLTTSEQLTCGCHVHVSVESDEEAVGVLDRIRVWLPALLALSANSPFWQGRDTKYASYRSQAMIRWPSAGSYDVFGSADGYHRLVNDMVSSGVLLDENMVYFDARLSRRYPTVEIRIADVCLDIRDTVMIAALARGLVDTAAREWAADEPPHPAPTTMVRLATWQAGREGLDGMLLDPQTFRPKPAEAVVTGLLEHVHPALHGNGDEAIVEEQLQRVLTRGNGAQRQRAVLKRTGQLTDVVAHLARVTAGHDE
jgi:carboxylate-amine ligase